MPRVVSKAEVDIDSFTGDSVVGTLASGEHSAVLRAYFGDTEYVDLRKLARRAVKLRNAGKQRVYLLPGMMGSSLGYRRKSGDHVVWLDPRAIARGELLALALPGGQALQPLEVMLPGYLKLKLRLTIAGFDVVFHPFDWRKSIALNGKLLLRRIRRERGKAVAIVAHSMGGLVARAALASDRHKRIDKVVQLGTPNFGSFAPVQALRAVYPTVRKVAALDPLHSAEQLARHVFRSLPGIYELLPATLHTRDSDWFDLRSWPEDLLGPDAVLLAHARRVRERLAHATTDCYHIIGINRETVTAVVKKRAGFDYLFTLDGDGTVPRTLAEWPGAKNFFVAEAHGCLQSNTVVAAAIVDLLRTGRTKRIASEWDERAHRVLRRASDAQLRSEINGKLRWEQLPIKEQRQILEPTISKIFRAEATLRVSTSKLRNHQPMARTRRRQVVK